MAQVTSPVIDPSTPTMAQVGANVLSVRSPAFSPPARSVLYAAFPIDSPFIGEPGQTYVPNPHVALVTNTGAPLLWHFLALQNTNTTSVGGFVEVWWAFNPHPQSGMTVTGTFGQRTKNVVAPVGGFKVVVVTGAAPDQSFAPVGVNASTSGTNSAEATVNAPAHSLVLGSVDTWNSVNNPPGFPTGQHLVGLVVNGTDVDSYWVQGLSRPTDVAGPVTMSATLSRTDAWHEIAWAVLPA